MFSPISPSSLDRDGKENTSPEPSTSASFTLALRWGGPLPICWLRLKGSWGVGFMVLVCRAESELVLLQLLSGGADR